jgi:hypothetical protein
VGSSTNRHVPALIVARFAYLTISVSAALVPTITATDAARRTIAPLVPVTVISNLVPAGALAGTVTINVATPLPTIDCGVKVMVAPMGAPAAVRSTREAKPR